MTETRPSAKRPKMKVHGLWIFGYSLEIRVMDETLKHDSSCVTELLEPLLLLKKHVFDFLQF